MMVIMAEFGSIVKGPGSSSGAGHLTAAWTELGRVFSSEGEASVDVRTDSGGRCSMRARCEGLVKAISVGRIVGAE
jgi:hypothetical protein